ncbi:hypothetical protein H2509_20410 [Stappia sp. F7233]|uniref:TIGR02217 family protein n=1 Tax=Stappia albiluteola TaxID=2758565 RepID=A0A839AI24_9HYPH|nr:hypothetical protein [Stappia albiluteola]MBA5779500.1 hypothetical protein [Stappia albiluteola]
MTITYPRELPVANIERAVFELGRDININARRGGGLQVVERGEARWRVEVTFGVMQRPDYQKVRAWWLSLQGGMREFLLHDPAHPRPIIYRTGFAGMTRHGGGAFDGDASVTALTPTALTISGLPTAFDLKAGDYVGLSEGGKRGLHMITEDATAAAGVVTVTVEPFVRTNIFTTAAAVHFDKPKAIFIPEPNSDAFEFGIGPRPFSFQAIQRIY